MNRDLHLAIESRQNDQAFAVATAFAEAGHDCVACRPTGTNALHRAAFRNMPQVISILSSATNIDREDDAGRTPLWIAAKHGNWDAVKQLLKAGADINRIDHKMRTPLMTALLDERKDAVMLLIRSGADVDYAIGPFGTPHEVASSLGPEYNDVVNLMNASKVNNKLVAAIRTGDSETAVSVAKDFVKNGYKCTDFRSKSGNNALHYAARFRGMNTVLSILVSNVKDVDSVNDLGASPLSSAAQQGNCDAVQTLLNKGADINHPDRSLRTPLMIALQHDGQEQVAKLLIARGANLNQPGREGKTALMLVAHQHRTELINLMLQHGAQLNATDSSGKTAADWARQHNEAVLALLGAPTPRAENSS